MRLPIRPDDHSGVVKSILCAIFLLMMTCWLVIAQDVPYMKRFDQAMQSNWNAMDQAVHDARQDEKILALEAAVAHIASNEEDHGAKLNWILGTVAGFGGLLALLQVMQIKKKNDTK